MSPNLRVFNVGLKIQHKSFYSRPLEIQYYVNSHFHLNGWTVGISHVMFSRWMCDSLAYYTGRDWAALFIIPLFCIALPSCVHRSHCCQSQHRRCTVNSYTHRTTKSIIEFLWFVFFDIVLLKVDYIFFAFQSGEK